MTFDIFLDFFATNSPSEELPLLIDPPIIIHNQRIRIIVSQIMPM